MLKAAACDGQAWQHNNSNSRGPDVKKRCCIAATMLAIRKSFFIGRAAWRVEKMDKVLAKIADFRYSIGKASYGGGLPHMNELTPKRRMLNAYRGIANDRVAIAPEFWYYYPAKLLGVDMIEFQREVPFHQALKTTFETFGCEGWGGAFCGVPNEKVESRCEEKWISGDQLELRNIIKTPHGELAGTQRLSRDEPSWAIERPIKDFKKDLPAYECATLDGDISAIDFASMIQAYNEVGESYLLEAWTGAPFFDYYGGAREGGLEAAVFDLIEHEARLEALQQRYIDYVVRLTGAICKKTPYESLAIGCSWSCNSLIGPQMWRRWDKPVIKAICDEVHRRGRLLHVHFHGKCMETVADFAALGIDCVCPFERPPGGDVDGIEGLREVARLLDGKVTMNGNIHTVETLIRGNCNDVRREVGEVMEAFAGNPRVIIGTGDQVGRETPEENLHAMIDEAKQLSR
ncbi:MAG: uroporphyrinogen decarboxylase family protein [Alphaproteobacteria bacterium]